MSAPCAALLGLRLPPVSSGLDIELRCTLRGDHEGRHEAEGMGTTAAWWCSGGGVVAEIRAQKRECREHPEPVINCPICARNGALDHAARLVERRG